METAKVDETVSLTKYCFEVFLNPTIFFKSLV